MLLIPTKRFLSTTTTISSLLSHSTIITPTSSFHNTIQSSSRALLIQQPQIILKKAFVTSTSLKVKTRYTLDNEEIYPSTDVTTLENLVVKYYQKLALFQKQKPISNHTKEAFLQVHQYLSDQNALDRIILDSGCGTGRSSIILAKKYPNHFTIGIDRSLSRLKRSTHYSDTKRIQLEQTQEEDADTDTTTKSSFMVTFQTIPNVILVRAELIDFWRCIQEEQQTNQWNIYKHYLLYPNPCPKKTGLKNRWYANQSLPILLSLGGLLIVRSNWFLYLQEFQYAVAFAIRNAYCDLYDTIDPSMDSMPLKVTWSNEEDTVCMSNFEQKYRDCGESVYEIQFCLKNFKEF